jgi:hypothetical protein
MSETSKLPATATDVLNPVVEMPTLVEGLSNDGPQGVVTSQNYRLLNTTEAAKYLGLSPHTLSKWRITGKGPPFHLLGRRCLYRPETLRVWSASKVRKSTSDPGGTVDE